MRVGPHRLPDIEAMGAHDLLERDGQIAALASAVSAAAAGAGSLVIVEGAAGLGKTRLLRAAAELSSPSTVVLRAGCEELERTRPWALVRSLFGDDGERVLGTGSEDPLPLIFSLYWLVADKAAESPLLLVIDDAQWADQPSLRFVRYLLPRLADLPVAVLLGRRTGEPVAEQVELDALAGDSRVLGVELAPLTEAAVGQLVRTQLGADADAEMIGACHEVTGGNPFYLSELARELRASRDAGEPTSARRVRQIRPASVARTVFLRISRLGADAAALARAVAILGERALFPHAAELARLEPSAASRAFDALAAAGILTDREPLTFAHPLVAGAIYSDIPPGERGDLHARAAKLLGRDGASAQEIASQLLQAGRRADPWAVEALLGAAAYAMSAGAVAAAAAQYLERALEEPPPAALRGDVLAALGRAEALLGRPRAAERFAEALELSAGPMVRAQLSLDLGRSLAGVGDHPRAAATFRAGLDGLGDASTELYRELHTAWVMSAALNPDAGRELPAREPDADPELPPTPGQRQLLTLTALRRAFEGGPQQELVQLADRAWGDGGLLDADAGVGMSWSLLTTVYCVADALERELEVCDAMLRDARRRGSPMAFATVNYCRAFPLLHQGRVDEAVADVQAALDAREDGWSVFVGSATGCLALAQLERGAIAQARAAIAPMLADPAMQASLEYLMILGAQGCLLLAENRPAEALEPLLRARRSPPAWGSRRRSPIRGRRSRRSPPASPVTLSRERSLPSERSLVPSSRTLRGRSRTRCERAGMRAGVKMRSGSSSRRSPRVTVPGSGCSRCTHSSTSVPHCAARTGAPTPVSPCDAPWRWPRSAGQRRSHTAREPSSLPPAPTSPPMIDRGLSR